MTVVRTIMAIAVACGVTMPPGVAIAQTSMMMPQATASPLLSGSAAQAQAQPTPLPLPYASTGPVAGAPGGSPQAGTATVYGAVPQSQQMVRRRMLATDRGTSYAPPPSRLPPGLLLSRPALSGQTSLTGERHDRNVFTATPLAPPSDATRTIGDVPGLTEKERLNPRLGLSTVRLASGQRLGGGLDLPSREAVTYDPRDLFDFRVKALEDPAQRPR